MLEATMNELTSLNKNAGFLIIRSSLLLDNFIITSKILPIIYNTL